VKIILIFLILFSVFSLCSEDKKNQLEFAFTYDKLSPAEDYEDWKTGTATFFRNQSKNLNYHLLLSGFVREENALLFAAGCTKTWTRKFYTSCGFSVGTESEYTTQIRLDGDLNYKFLKKENLVFTTGLSYINYYNDHEDYVLFSGPTFYYGKFLFVYNLHYATNYPGAKTSNSHVFSIGYGEDKKDWTYLTVKAGTQSYLATYLPIHEDVNNEFYDVAVNHRHWFRDNFGMFADLSFIRITDGYDKYGFLLGIFRRF
jgi:YaiO family outer membrane protein